MNNQKKLISMIIIIFGLFLFLKPFFIIKEGEMAIVVRFGKIISSITSAGFNFKIPIIDNVVKYPSKIQSWDGEAQRLPTEENQFIWVDSTARWKIKDPKLFYEAVGNITSAQSRLDDVIDSSVRKIIVRNQLREAVRNSNIINEIKRKNVFAAPQQLGEKSNKSLSLISSTYTNVKYEEISTGREKLSEDMLSEAKKVTPQYGITLIDIIIRQIKYSDDLTQSVYNRMIKERSQIAQAFRSDGEGKKAEWLGRREKELRSIQSNATRKAKEIKAKADGKALEIRNKAYNKDPEFAEYWIALLDYQKLLPPINKTITTDMEFFKYLYNKDIRK